MPVGAALPIVQSCEATACAYNGEHHCHAAAITVGNSGSAACETFMPADVRGGVDSGDAQVGACKMADCVHNENLECTAEEISVDTSGASAVCLTFTPR
jgi:hypothetical protein